MNKETIKNSFKSIAKKSINSIKNTFEKVKNEITYINEANVMYIISSKDKPKINKMIFTIFDKNNMAIYIKTSDFLNRLNHIQEKTIIKDSKNNKYEVINIDSSKTYEYLLKNKQKYNTIKCYKIMVKDAV